MWPIFLSKGVQNVKKEGVISRLVHFSFTLGIQLPGTIELYTHNLLPTGIISFERMLLFIS